MKNRTSWYVVVTLITGLLVTFSVLMPGVLLSKAEDSTLNSPYTISDGTSSFQQHGSDVTSTPSAPSVRIAQLTRNVQFYEQGATKSVLAKENIDSSMDIKTAVDACIQQMTTLLKKGALPPLDGFPKAYRVSAELRTILDTSGNPALQYWDINLGASADMSTTHTKISVILDAQTGIFLSMEISVESIKSIDLAHSAETIAQSMNIPGKMLSLTPQAASWMFDNSSILMQLTLDETSFTNFRMVMSVNKLLPT